MNEIECLKLFFVGLGYFLIDKYSEANWVLDSVQIKPWKLI